MTKEIEEKSEENEKLKAALGEKETALAEKETALAKEKTTVKQQTTQLSALSVSSSTQQERIKGLEEDLVKAKSERYIWSIVYRLEERLTERNRELKQSRNNEVALKEQAKNNEVALEKQAKKKTQQNDWVPSNNTMNQMLEASSREVEQGRKIVDLEFKITSLNAQINELSDTTWAAKLSKAQSKIELLQQQLKTAGTVEEMSLPQAILQARRAANAKTKSGDKESAAEDNAAINGLKTQISDLETRSTR